MNTSIFWKMQINKKQKLATTIISMKKLYCLIDGLNGQRYENVGVMEQNNSYTQEKDKLIGSQIACPGIKAREA